VKRAPPWDVAQRKSKPRQGRQKNLTADERGLTLTFLLRGGEKVAQPDEVCVTHQTRSFQIPALGVISPGSEKTNDQN
jgi:hypothetical protein